MEIGKLKHRIKIYKVENTINDEGGYEEMPTTIATPFCEVSKTTIKEFRNEDLDTRRETIVFIIRYRQQADIHTEKQTDASTLAGPSVTGRYALYLHCW